MTFADVPAGVDLFLDANSFIYHFTNDAKYGAACTQLLKRIEQQEIQGFTSAHILADVAHRLMTIEAMSARAWPPAGIAARLRKHHDEIPKLTVFRHAVARIPLMGIQTLPISQTLVETATILSAKHELMTGDALVVAVMQGRGLAHLASNDTDFDRVSGITRYAPL